MGKTAFEKRAGTYIKQIEGYAAFIPAPLPPEPPVNMDPELIRCLSDADRALGRLDGATVVFPNPDLFVAMYVKQEAVFSSQIEGTAKHPGGRAGIRSRPGKGKKAEGRGGGRQLCQRNEPRSQGTRQAAPEPEADQANPRGAVERSSRRRADPGRVQKVPELDRTGWLHSRRRRVRASPSPPDERGLGQFRKIPPRRFETAGSDSLRIGPRPVRNHPPVPGRQWTNRPTPDHVSFVSKGGAEKAPAISQLFSQGASSGILRPLVGNPELRRLGRLASLFSARRSRCEQRIH